MEKQSGGPGALLWGEFDVTGNKCRVIGWQERVY